jgi:hypothetical protein
MLAFGLHNFSGADAPNMRASAKLSDTNVSQARSSDGLGDAEFVRNSGDVAVFGERCLNVGEQLGAGFGPMVSLTRVSAVRRFHYQGPVYNFESETNVLVSDGIVNHNCRCFSDHVVDWLRG